MARSTKSPKVRRIIQLYDEAYFAMLRAEDNDKSALFVARANQVAGMEVALEVLVGKAELEQIRDSAYARYESQREMQQKVKEVRCV